MTDFQGEAEAERGSSKPSDPVPGTDSNSPDTAFCLSAPGSLCISDGCPVWQEILSYSAEGKAGNKSCLWQAISNGASVRITLKLRDGLEHTYDPVEFKQTAGKDAYFYIGPAYNEPAAAGVWRKNYIGVSTSGYYRQLTYDMQNKEVYDTLVKPLQGKFFIRRPHCNYQGTPKYFSNENSLMYDSSEPAVMSNNDFLESAPGFSGDDLGVEPAYDSDEALYNATYNGAVLAVHLQLDGNMVKSIRADWTIVDMRYPWLAAMKLRGDEYKDADPPSYTVAKPLRNDIKIMMKDGMVSSLFVDSIDGGLETVLEEGIVQYWFADTCWDLVFNRSKDGVETDDKDTKNLISVLHSGAKMRVQIAIDSQIYTMGLHMLFCTVLMGCRGAVQLHPHLDEFSTSPFMNVGDSTYPYASWWMGSQFSFYSINEETSYMKRVAAKVFADQRPYIKVFEAVSYTVMLDDLATYVKNGANFRLVANSTAVEGFSIFYDVEEVVQVTDSADADVVTSYLLYSYVITESPVPTNTCPKGTHTTATRVKLSSHPFSLSMTILTHDFQSVCSTDKDIVYPYVYVFASR